MMIGDKQKRKLATALEIFYNLLGRYLPRYPNVANFIFNVPEAERKFLDTCGLPEDLELFRKVLKKVKRKFNLVSISIIDVPHAFPPVLMRWSDIYCQVAVKRKSKQGV